jgi:hypothetical protein
MSRVPPGTPSGTPASSSSKKKHTTQHTNSTKIGKKRIKSFGLIESARQSVRYVFDKGELKAHKIIEYKLKEEKHYRTIDDFNFEANIKSLKEFHDNDKTRYENNDVKLDFDLQSISSSREIVQIKDQV